MIRVIAVIELRPLLIAMAGGLVAWIAVGVAQRILTYFWGRRVLRRVIDRVKHPENYANEASARGTPWSRFIVRMSESGVACERPDGKLDEIEWDELQRVELMNTDEGPWLPDVFWVLHGAQGGCVIPWGATGEIELLKRLQKLPGFDSSVILDSAASTGSETRLCWSRK